MKHVGEAGVAEAACVALRNMCADAGNEKRAGEEGAIKAVVADVGLARHGRCRSRKEFKACPTFQILGYFHENFRDLDDFCKNFTFFCEIPKILRNKRNPRKHPKSRKFTRESCL